MTKRILAEVFPLGEYLRDELEARGQTVEQLCEGTKLSPKELRRLIDDPGFYLDLKCIERLAGALGVHPGTLYGLQCAWEHRQWGG